jgi:hypothetical protein
MINELPNFGKNRHTFGQAFEGIRDLYESDNFWYIFGENIVIWKKIKTVTNWENFPSI